MTLHNKIKMDAEQRETIRLVNRDLGNCRLLLESKLVPYFDEYIASESDLIERYVNCGLSGVDDRVAGRGALHRLTVDTSEGVIIRENRRGGIIRFFNSSYYLVRGAAVLKKIFSSTDFDAAFEYRPFCEISILSQLSRRGLPVPIPAFALLRPLCGGLVYSGAVATWEIPGARNLLHIVQDNALQSLQTQGGRNLFFEIGRLARRVLEEGVYHADFHLGNILLDQSDSLVLIDFDKARYFEPGAELTHFGTLLLDRWQRSVKRHADALGALEEQAVSEFTRGLSI